MVKDGKNSSVKDIIVDNFDNEQIWAQLNLDFEKFTQSYAEKISEIEVGLKTPQKLRKRREKLLGIKSNKSSILLDTQDAEISEDDDEEEEEEEEEHETEEDDDSVYLSNFQKKQAALREKINELEEENLSKKHFLLRGEITGDRRPENSLLENNLDYDFVTKPAPLISEEITDKIEQIIKQRIKDQLWDDVERKKKPVELPFEYKRRLNLEQTKSKVSLAEVYEKEFLGRQTEEKKQEEPEAHKEIRKLLSQLFLKLDALSNYNFTPKPPEPEIKIINNLPSISAEEAIPITVSEGTLLAPEEVVARPKRPVKGDTEKDETDRKRERRLKKKKAKTISKKNSANLKK